MSDYRCDPGCPHKASGHCYSGHGCRCDVCRKANADRSRRQRALRDPSTLPPEAHGKDATYRNWNCRCTLCREAGTEANRPHMAAHLKRLKGRPVPDGQHGKTNTYNRYACRCTPCSQAKAEYNRTYRENRKMEKLLPTLILVGIDTMVV